MYETLQETSIEIDLTPNFYIWQQATKLVNNYKQVGMQVTFVMGY